MKLDVTHIDQKMGRGFAAGFGRSRSGNFAMMLALVAPVIFGAAGMMVDTTRLYAAQTKLSDAIDAAVLATTQDLTSGAIAEADAEQAIRRWLDTNSENTTLGTMAISVDDITINKADRTVAVEASVDVPMVLMQVVGFGDQRVVAETKAAYSNTKVEVAMALDVTGSMSGEKIASLKKAASSAVDILLPNAAAQSRVRIGLVPYSSTVNARPILPWISVNGASDGCVYERTDANEYSDAFADAYSPLNGTTDGAVCVNAEIKQMTNDAVALKSHINAMTTGGWTAGHLGISWVHYMLSPKWNPAWAFASDVTPYGSTGIRKYGVIMTDGMFNTYLSSGPAGSSQVQSEEAARRMCDSMKTKDIKVYTIAFQAPAEAASLMEECANEATGTSQYFFNATNEAELIAAFEAIARDIEGLRLIN